MIEYVIQVYYFRRYGWEDETVEDTMDAARAQQATYRANCGYPVRIKRRRVSA